MVILCIFGYSLTMGVSLGFVYYVIFRTTVQDLVLGRLSTFVYTMYFWVLP